MTTPPFPSHLRTKNSYRTASLEKLAKLMLDIVLSSAGQGFAQARGGRRNNALRRLTCPPPQVRWCGALHTLLREKKRLLRLEIPWRPLVSLLRDAHLVGDQGFEGTAITMSHMNAVGNLVRASRRFFPPGCAGEIWASLRPAFANLGSADAMHAAGWAALLLPCTALATDDDSVPWPELVREMFALLRAVPDCRYWSAVWMSTLARCAKHDVRARVDWAAHAGAGLAAALASFELPIGGAQGSPPWSRHPPREAAYLFGGEARSRGRGACCVLSLTRFALFCECVA